MTNILIFKYKEGKQLVYPANWMVKDWLFTEDEKDEAELAHHMAVVAEKNGLNENDLYRLFPALLRILKSNIDWSQKS